MKYHYNLLKSGAKRRGKSVDLSFEEYEKLARESGYDERRGKEACCLSLDRLDDTKGYSIDNLRVTTLSENCSKDKRKLFIPYFQALSESDKADESEGDGPWLDLPTGTNPF